MIKQQRVLIIVLAILFTVMLAAYFIIVKPLTTEEETEAVPPETKDGEALTYSDYFLLFPQVERANIQSIEVHNDYGEFKFVRNGESESAFVIEGFENLAFDEELFSQLVVSAGYAMAPMKITEDPTEQQLEDYGFINSDDVSYYILTTTSGEVHKVYIGEKIISGGGYYAMYEGRNTIYLLSSSIEESLLVPIESLVSPLITAGIETTEYYLVNNFTIKHYGEDFLSCRNLSSDELSDMETTAIAKSITVYPTEYNLSINYDTTLQELVYYSGESVVALGLSDEHMEEYGLKDAPYEISYTFGDMKIYLTASELTDDGYYYVASSLFQIIAKVPGDDFAFLRWNLLKWIDPNVFSRNITFVSSIEVEGGEFRENFVLHHHPNETPNLVVIGDEYGEIDDVANFREFYKTLLLLAVEEYAPEDEDIISDKNLMCKFTVTTKGGSVTEYGFYRYSTRRALVTINGSGQFYCLVDTPEKILDDAKRVVSGEDINAYDKN